MDQALRQDRLKDFCSRRSILHHGLSKALSWEWIGARKRAIKHGTFGAQSGLQIVGS